MSVTLPDRFWQKVKVVESGCWEWQAARSSMGYGRFVFRRPSGELTHRLAYEALVGPIPPGMEMDHLCRNPPCLNPAHLEPVTHHENALRGRRSRATHCSNGHPWDEANTHWYRGYRQCRACSAASCRKRYAKRRASWQ